MAGIGILFALFAFVVPVAGGVVLYSFVRAEHERRPATDRKRAEEIARRDARDADAEDDAVQGNHWG